MSKYQNGLQYGQQVISIWEGEANARKGLPRLGAIGIVRNYDHYDHTTLIDWPAGAFDPPYENRAFQLWTAEKVNGKPLFKAYIPEPTRLANGQRLCENCGCIVEDDSEEAMVYVVNYGWICADCYEREFATCSGCGEIHKKSNLHSVRTKRDGNIVDALICESCLEIDGHYYKCGCCQEWHDTRVDYKHVSGYGYYICDPCLSDSGKFATCSDCGSIYERVDLKEVHGFEGLLCERCADRFRRKAIHNYGYKPEPKYKVESHHDQFDTDESITDLLFGVELEIDKGDDDAGCACELTETIDDIYCKHDGSLNCGVEIVSHPCTLNYHLNELGWDKIVEIARKYKFKSHEAKTCGLHVHVGRRQLGDTPEHRLDTAGKCVLAMYRHWDNMVKFSRRLPSQLSWGNRNEVEFIDAFDEDRLISAALETEEEGRYQAVNLCNEKTIEFRLWRGTLELNTIKATLELVSNICEYCKDHSAFQVMNSQWEDIAYYKNYPELCDYLITRELAQTSMLSALPAWNFTKPPVLRSDIYDSDINWEATDDLSFPELYDNSLYNHTSSCSTEEFSVGEYVLVVNHSSGEDDAPVGRVGRVFKISGRWLHVNFSSSFPGSHYSNNELRNPTGYHIHADNLVHYHSATPPTILIPYEEHVTTATSVQPELVF